MHSNNHPKQITNTATKGKRCRKIRNSEPWISPPASKNDHVRASVIEIVGLDEGTLGGACE